MGGGEATRAPPLDRRRTMEPTGLSTGSEEESSFNLESWRGYNSWTSKEQAVRAVYPSNYIQR